MVTFRFIGPTSATDTHPIFWSRIPESFDRQEVFAM